MATRVEPKGEGWRAFAGVMILLVGVFNFIDGMVAVASSSYLSHHLVFGSFNSWGWAILILGAFQFLVGLAILAGQTWAAFVGILFALVDAIGQLLFLPSYPVWSIVIIAIDVIVIYGLAMYGMVPADRR